jgi:hypothetical protein
MAMSLLAKACESQPVPFFWGQTTRPPFITTL